MAEPDDRRTDGAPPQHIHIEKKTTNWIPWILLGLGLLALLFALTQCDRHKNAAVAPVPTATSTDVITTTTTDTYRSTALGTSGLGTYLAGTEPAPRTFTFEKLNFDTASSKVRAEDADEVAAIANTLKQYPNARIRIAGYADGRGSDAANAKLGDARAESVKDALVAKGTDASRIATGTGGEADPVDTNTTASGQAENRRTELVVTQR